MPDLPIVPPTTYEQLDAAHIAADRARQLDEALYAQALTDPESCDRYRNDLGFRMEIDQLRNALHAMDAALADEGATPEQRNRILQRVITGREPYRGVDITFGPAAPIRLPHGPFSITAEPAALVDGRFVRQALVVHCTCSCAQKWEGSMSGGQLLAWLHDHPAEREQFEAAAHRQATGVAMYDLTPQPRDPDWWTPLRNRIPRSNDYPAGG